MTGFLSLSEFYLRTPAIAILFIVHLAILVKCGTMASDQEPVVRTNKTPERLAVFVIGLLLLGAMGRYAYGQYVSQNLLDQVERQKSECNKSDIFRAISIRPDNPKACGTASAHSS